MKNGMLTFALAFSASAVLAAEPDVSTWMHMSGNDSRKNSSWTRANWLDPENPSAAVVTIANSTKQLFYADRTIYTPYGVSTFPGTTLAVGSGVTLYIDYQNQTIGDLRLFGGCNVSCCTSWAHLSGNVTVYGDADHPVRYNTGTYLHRYWNIYANFKSDTPSAVINLGNDSATKTRDYFESGDWAERVELIGSWDEYYGTLNLTKGTYYKIYSSFKGLPGKMKICGNAYACHYQGSLTMTFGELELDDGALWMLQNVTENTPHCIVTNKLTITGHPLIYKTDATTDGYIDIIRLTGDAATSGNLPDVSNLQLDPQSPLYLKLKDFNPHFILADGTDGDKIVRLTWDALKYLTAYSGSSVSSFASAAASCWTPAGVPTTEDSGIFLKNTLNVRTWGTLSYPNTTVICDNALIYTTGSRVEFAKIVFVGDKNALTASGYGPSEGYAILAPLELRDATLSINGWSSRKARYTGPISGTGAIKIAGRNDVGLSLEGDNSDYAGSMAASISSGVDGYSDEILAGAERPTYYLSFGQTNALGGAYTGSTDAWKANSFSHTWSRFTDDVTIDEPTRGVCFSNVNALEVDEGFSFTVGSDATYDGQIYKRGNGTLVLAGAAPHFINGGERVDAPVAASNVLKVAAGSLKIAGTNAVNGLAVTFAEGATWTLDLGATGDLKTYGAINTAWSAPFASEATNGKIVLTVDVNAVAATAGAFEVAICTVSKSAPTLAFDFAARKRGRVYEVTTRDNGDSLTYLMKVSGKCGLAVILR